MIIGFSTSSLYILVAAVIGIPTSLIGGKIDMVVQRFVDAWMCFPAIIFLIAILSLFGRSMWNMILILGLQYGVTGTRVIRSGVMGIKNNVYFDAAKAEGCSTLRIITRHVLPNIMAPMIIMFSTVFPAIVLTEATLSFLGYGIPPPMPSWGGMLSGSGRSYMLMAPWMAIYPGLALTITVYSVNMFGDALRDILDPRLRGGLGRYGTAVKKRQAVMKRTGIIQCIKKVQ
jgi:peptide/nickel transport system permease protein